MATQVWVATAAIYIENVRAYNINYVVPDSVVIRFGLEAQGLVERRNASDTGVPANGVDPATQAELTAALAALTPAAIGALDQTAGDARYGLAERAADYFATPDANLTFTPSSSVAIPFSVGTDGKVYASAGVGSAQIVRTSDGFATTETGPDLAALGAVGTLIYAGRVAEGYVAVVTPEGLFGAPGSNNSLAAGAQIWRSTSFTSGWALVQSIGGTRGIAISRPEVDPVAGGTVWVIGEYSQTAGATHQLWLSRNGGQTWTSIHAFPAVDAANNNHYHGCCFDTATRRIYASHGDGKNAWFGYTPDFGTTWVPVPGMGIVPPASTSTFHQPVLVTPTDRGIATDPDAGVGVSGVWNVDRRTGNVSVVLEGLGATLPADQYAEHPVARTDREIYAVFPMRGARNTNTVYVAATGDGGRTWYKVYSAAQAANEAYERGIVGPDSAGRLFLHSRQTDVSNTGKLLVANKLTWTANRSPMVRQASGDLRALLVSAGLLDPNGVATLDLLGGKARVGNLDMTTLNATLTMGDGTNVAAINTPSGTSSLRVQPEGTQVASWTKNELNMVEGKNIKTGTTTGSMVASTATQKLGFYGATPIVRPTGTPAAATDLATALTLLNDIRAKLIALGLIG